MSLAGHLNDLPLPDLLQIVAMAEKTGRLDLTTREGEGLIVFRGGRIIYAASNAAREALGSILVCRRLVSEAVLRQALERQYRSREERRLGSILVQMGALSTEALEAVIFEQIEKVIGELARWHDGYFKFEAMDIPDHGEISVDAREFLVESGLSTQRVALEFSRLADEARHAAGAGTPARSPSAAADLEPGRRASAGAGSAPPRASLGGILASRASHSLTAERSLELLRAGEGFFRRAVLMLVERHGLAGVGQFGVRPGDETVEESIRNLWLPLDAPSLVAEAAASGRTRQGRLDRSESNQLLVGELGGEWPAEAAALPIKAGSQVVAVLYGDTVPDATPLPALDRLEAKLVAVGAAIAAADNAPARA